MKATVDADKLLMEARAMLAERGAEYDAGRERSMRRIVELFAAMTGIELTEVEGWRFMQAVKRARLETSPKHADSKVDLIAYVALEMEASDETSGD